MNKFLRYISNLIFYGGLNKDKYRAIRGRISEENRRSTNVFTLLGALAFLITGISGSIMKQGASTVLYYTGVGIFILMFLLNFFLGKKHPIISDVFAISFSVIVLGFGIAIAYSQSQERTTMLLPLFGLVSLVFCYRPIYLLVILTISEIVFLILMKSVQPYELYFVNMVNTVIFSIIGLIGGLYTLSFKHKKHEVDYDKQALLEKDVLTGLLNRYSWKKAFEKIEKEKLHVSICSMDVNGLKIINDTKGHLAGDELIVGAAVCIQDVFGKIGDVYRVGGDEFSVLIYEEFDEQELRKKLDDKTKSWEGNKCKGMSISLGIAKLDFDKENSIEDAIHRADLEMYKEKQEYYEKQNKNI